MYHLRRGFTVHFTLRPMEDAATLLELLDDAGTVAKLSEKELITRLENVRRQLRFSKGASLPSALVACHATVQTVANIVTRRGLTDKTASSKAQKCVLLLETAVADALASLRYFENGVNPSGKRGLDTFFKQLLQTLWETSPSSQWATNAVMVMTRLGVLLGCTWLSYDRVGNLTKILELLTICSEFCLQHDSTQQFVKWPLFLLAMVHLVERKNHREALECFKKVAKVKGDVLGGGDGVFHYWHAVVLLCNGGLKEAESELDKCIQKNYEPVACLSLKAMAQLQSQDFHAAVEQLQRALEIDFSQPRSLLNYALLMGRLKNFETQQQMLEYVLEFCEDNGKLAQKKKRKHPSDDGNCLNTKEPATVLFDDTKLAPLFPSQLTSVNILTVNLQLAVSAMENGSWLESKKYFEEYLGSESQCRSQSKTMEAARDYIYVLLQCNLPSLALSKCSQLLLQVEGSNFTHEDEVIVVSVLLLHLYKADSLLCLERVDECYEYLKHIIQPKIQVLLQLSSQVNTTEATFVEVTSCHTQLLNNLAVVTTCCDGVDAAIVILREGLQQYPDCLALKFNLVLLLWRNGEKTTACSMWVEARGWTLTNDPAEVNPLSDVISYGNAAVSASTPQTPLISEHVQGGGEGNVSENQLVYLDALILNHWRKTRNAKVAETSLQYVEYFESLGTSSSIQHN